MTLNYEFVEEPGSYLLKLNNRVCKVYSKSRFSKTEAEDKASDEVNKSVKKSGIKNVSYDGCLQTS